jgi:hypothetical protein
MIDLPYLRANGKVNRVASYIKYFDIFRFTLE